MLTSGNPGESPTPFSCRIGTTEVVRLQSASRPTFTLSPDKLLRGEKHEHDCGENHELGVKKDEYAGVVEAPLALEAAGGLSHAPYGDQQSENLPVGAVEVFYMREAGEVQAGGKCAEREKNGADERFLPQAEDREEMMHNPFNVRRLRGVGDLRA